MTTNYERGARFERLVMTKLEEAGWFVFRSAGSHKVADVIAARKLYNFSFPHLVFVQAKSSASKTKKAGWPGPAERRKLTDQAKRAGASAIIARKVPGKQEVEWVEIRNERIKERTPWHP